jgi:WD40 repeat protein
VTTTTAAFSPDGKWLAIGGEEETAVWLFDVGSGERKHVLDVR